MNQGLRLTPFCWGMAKVKREKSKTVEEGATACWSGEGVAVFHQLVKEGIAKVAFESRPEGGRWWTMGSSREACPRQRAQHVQGS